MKVLCEVSVRHVHLSTKDLESLFGKGAKLEEVRGLSQPHQFVSAQKVDIVGPKRTIEGVSVLGPVRAETQVEVSRTDCFTLGIKDVPVRQSGFLEGTPGIVLKNGDKSIALPYGVIVMQRHVHLDPATASANKIKDGQLVDLVFGGERGGVLSNTVVRINKDFAPAVHIDSDEGNAMAASNEVTLRVK